MYLDTMRGELIGHFEPCMTDIYLHIFARMAYYIHQEQRQQLREAQRELEQLLASGGDAAAGLKLTAAQRQRIRNAAADAANAVAAVGYLLGK